MYRFEWIAGSLVVGLLVFSMVMTVWSYNDTKATYAVACAKIHGNPVWNGKQWECFPNNLLDYGDD